jgi:hypothetical protein
LEPEFPLALELAALFGKGIGDDPVTLGVIHTFKVSIHEPDLKIKVVPPPVT